MTGPPAAKDREGCSMSNQSEMIHTALALVCTMHSAEQSPLSMEPRSDDRTAALGKLGNCRFAVFSGNLYTALTSQSRQRRTTAPITAADLRSEGINRAA